MEGSNSNIEMNDNRRDFENDREPLPSAETSSVATETLQHNTMSADKVIEDQNINDRSGYSSNSTITIADMALESPIQNDAVVVTTPETCTFPLMEATPAIQNPVANQNQPEIPHWVQVMMAELIKVQESCKKGQESFNKGQESLKKGQENLRADFNKGQENLSKKLDSTISRIEALEKRQDQIGKSLDQKFSAFHTKICGEVADFQANIRTEIVDLSEKSEQAIARCDRLEKENEISNTTIATVQSAITHLEIETRETNGQLSSYMHEVRGEMEGKVSQVSAKIDKVATSVISLREDSNQLKGAQDKLREELLLKYRQVEGDVNTLKSSPPTQHTHTGQDNNIHIDLKLPKFCSYKDINPKAFLSELEIYFKIKAVPDNLKLLIIRQAMLEPDRYWYDVSCNLDMSYADFRELFLRTFWSHKHQSQTRMKMYQGRYEPKTNDSMGAYVERLVVLSRYLDQPMSETEFITAVTTHFSPQVQAHINPVIITTISQFLETLKNLDSIGHKASQEQKSKGESSGQIKGQQDGKEHGNRGSYNSKNSSYYNNYKPQFRNEGGNQWKDRGRNENKGAHQWGKHTTNAIVFENQNVGEQLEDHPVPQNAENTRSEPSQHL